MEPSIWHKFAHFIRQSTTEKFKTFYPGVLVGLFGAKSLLFSGLPSEVVTLGAYAIKYIGTVIMAFSSGLATAFGAYLIDRHKERQKKSPSQPEKRRNNRAA